MSETKNQDNIYKKLQAVRQHIKKSDLKKSGRNDFGKYDYYTPNQVELLVQQATDETGTIVLCNLKQDEFGLYQELEFIDIEGSNKILVFQLRTKMGVLTATNKSQQMGSTDTYSERYIKMKVFGIKDNSLDPDSTDQRKSSEKSMTADQKKQIEDGAEFLPAIEQGKLNGWLKKKHTYQEAEKTLDKMNKIIDENA